MIDNRLGTELRSLVRRYGIEQVDRSLREIRRSGAARDNGRGVQPASGGSKTRTRRDAQARSAPEYVAKMDFIAERRPAMSELAKRFHEKTFLPSFGDVRRFCESYGIDAPASNSRAGAIPRVFKFMATMDRDEIQRIVDYQLFSGPSRLGPIAEAIRANGRAAASRAQRMQGAAGRAGHTRNA